MFKIIVAVVIIAIYLLVLKPNQVRQECLKIARQESVATITVDVEADETERQLMQTDYEELVLKECLEENGIGD